MFPDNCHGGYADTWSREFRDTDLTGVYINLLTFWLFVNYCNYNSKVALFKYRIREYKAHLFQPNIAFKIGVRIRFECALDSSTNLNNIQLYRFLRNNV